MDTVWARGALSFHKKTECKDTKKREKNKLKHTTFLRHFFCDFRHPLCTNGYQELCKNNSHEQSTSQQVNKSTFALFGTRDF